MAAAQRDSYEIPGVPRDADAKAIKETIRRLAMKYHPDRNKSPEAKARFKEVTETYAILSDPKKTGELRRPWLCRRRRIFRRGPVLRHQSGRHLWRGGVWLHEPEHLSKEEKALYKQLQALASREQNKQR
jgi:curved DNA-binding protein CbpA